MAKIKRIIFSVVSFFLIMGLAVFTGCGGSDSGGWGGYVPRTAPESDFLPVVFVHGGSGSASQFESQAQRFIANGYPIAYLVAYEHNTGSGAPAPQDQIDGLDEIIDAVLASSRHSQVNIISHSRGAGLGTYYLESSPARAAKVGHYVTLDSQSLLNAIDDLALTGTPGGVNMLALWGEYVSGGGVNLVPDPRTVDGATNVYLPDQAHIQIATSAESFVEIFKFFNDEEPEIDYIPIAPGETVQIQGKVSYFPANTGALGTLEIYELNAVTAQRVGGAVATYTIDTAGTWGPLNVTKGVYYEFAFEHTAGGKHYFYREPFLADNYFIRLNTSEPGGGIGVLLTRTESHSNIIISRDKELWGDQGEGIDDILVVDTEDLFASAGGEEAAARTKRLSGLFLLDWGPVAPANGLPNIAPFNTSGYYDPHVLGETNLSAPIGIFHGLSFMSGLDLYMQADENRVITVELTPRGGGGFKQIINVPAWPSNEVRITVHFRDFVRQANPVVFVHGFAGSASQFESQAQRFIANGYPLTHLKVYENDTSGATAITVQVGQLNAIIDAVRASTGASQVDLIGHSRGTFVSQAYLGASPTYADKVAHYVNVDGAGAAALPGGVPALALWGDGYLLPSGEVVGATNIYRTDQSHIQVATSKESFTDIFRFFTSRVPAFTQIPDAHGATVEIAGRAIYFPVNVGAPGTLEIYEIDPATTARSGAALATYTLTGGIPGGYWGPLTVDKGVTLEFAFEHTAGVKHYFYREAFMADNYFVRLNTSDPADPTALGNLMAKSANHTDILISRDKEMWGNQGADNDSLTVGGTEIMTPVAAARTKHLSGLFLMDWGPDNAEPLGATNEPDQVTDLTTAIATFNLLPFMSGLDLYMPTSPAGVIQLVLTPRGGDGATQVVNVPNLPSDEIRISVHFRDFVQ